MATQQQIENGKQSLSSVIVGYNYPYYDGNIETQPNTYTAYVLMSSYLMFRKLEEIVPSLFKGDDRSSKERWQAFASIGMGTINDIVEDTEIIGKLKESQNPIFKLDDIAFSSIGNKEIYENIARIGDEYFIPAYNIYKEMIKIKDEIMMETKDKVVIIDQYSSPDAVPYSDKEKINKFFKLKEQYIKLINEGKKELKEKVIDNLNMTTDLLKYVFFLERTAELWRMNFVEHIGDKSSELMAINIPLGYAYLKQAEEDGSSVSASALHAIYMMSKPEDKVIPLAAEKLKAEDISTTLPQDASIVDQINSIGNVSTTVSGISPLYENIMMTTSYQLYLTLDEYVDFSNIKTEKERKVVESVKEGLTVMYSEIFKGILGTMIFAKNDLLASLYRNGSWEQYVNDFNYLREPLINKVKSLIKSKKEYEKINESYNKIFFNMIKGTLQKSLLRAHWIGFYISDFLYSMMAQGYALWEISNQFDKIIEHLTNDNSTLVLMEKTLHRKMMFIIASAYEEGSDVFTFLSTLPNAKDFIARLFSSLLDNVGSYGLSLLDNVGSYGQESQMLFSEILDRISYDEIDTLYQLYFPEDEETLSPSEKIEKIISFFKKYKTPREQKEEKEMQKQNDENEPDEDKGLSEKDEQVR